MDDRQHLPQGDLHAAVPDTPRAAPFPGSISDLIAAQAARTPDRTAIAWSGGDAWTYAQLLHAADGIAHALLARGVGRGELVGVYLPRRPEMVAAILGVLRAGAAYLPLDPVFPPDRLRYMVEHARVRQMLVWDAGTYPGPLPTHVSEFALRGFEPGPETGARLPTPVGDDLAYVLYTSGSTGQPKGVRILRRNLTNFLCSMRRCPGIDADDVMGAFTTLSFDIAALEIYLPLLVGASLVLAATAEQTDRAAAAKLMHAHPMTMLQSTPTLLRLLLGGGHLDLMRGIRLLIGGEALPRDLAEQVLPECAELWNLYGPTETTVWSTLHRVTPGAGSVPLGTPIANTTIHILDDALRPVADGDTGEIWIGGAGVADGYLNDPGKTAERFLPDPFAGDGSRMYRTGDLGRVRDGLLYFDGRADDQIKLHGFRIEPGEIEAAALAEPGVRDAVAVARDLGGGDRRLILYVTADPESGLKTRLRAGLNARLPAYARPQYVEILDALPRTPNGKIDRKALPSPVALVAAPAESGDAGGDGLQAAITAIWREVLKVRQIGPHDDFFELGGDSLLAVRVFERTLALTGADLPLATLLTAPTIAQQLVAFRTAGAREPARPEAPAVVSVDAWSSLVPLQPRGTRPPLFLIHALGGNVLNYVPLARGLDADQPAYGVQALGLDGIARPTGSIAVMAAGYVAEIRRLQARGPYFLAGGSMGGLIAYAMACLLRQQGEPVGLLALFDTAGPHRGTDAPLPRAPLPVRLAAAPFARLRRYMDALRVRRARAAGRALPHTLRYREVERVHHQALRNYHPQPYPGRIVLFRATGGRDRARLSTTLGWDGYVQGGIEAIDLPGGHADFIEQPELLEHLRTVLRRAQADAAP